MKIRTGLLSCALLSVAQVTSLAAGATDNPLTTSSKGLYQYIRTNVLKAAEQMPESDYGFKPVETVRTFGELVGHVADGQYEFCSAVVNEKKAPDVEKTAKTKAQLVEALKTAYSYCDKVYSDMTDADAAKQVAFFGRQYPKLTVLDLNTAHTDEHYGNIVTYMRIKGMVPPSTKQ